MSKGILSKKELNNYKFHLNRSMGITVIMLAALLLIADCQHARVTLPPPIPSACKVDQTSRRAQRLCERMKEEQAKRIESQAQNRPKFRVAQSFYLWGLYPKKMEYAATDICSTGIYEIYQYSSLKDSVYSHISLGVFVPRTLEITCY